MYRIALVILLVIGCSATAFAEAEIGKSSATSGFQPQITYNGKYKAERLYQYNAFDQTWYGSVAPKIWRSLPCAEARAALSGGGEWTGVLTETGACAGKAEGQQWATGNYLNFLAGGSPVAAPR